MIEYDVCCFRTRRSSVACSSTMLNLFLLYSILRILCVHLYRMSKFDWEKKLCFFDKCQIRPEHWVLHLLFLLQHFSSLNLRVLFFCPILINKFGMNVYLVVFMRQMIFFRSSKFGGPHNSNILLKSPKILNSTKMLECRLISPYLPWYNYSVEWLRFQKIRLPVP